MAKVTTSIHAPVTGLATATDENAVMEKERELDQRHNRPPLLTVPKEAWPSYPTGFGKTLGELSTKQREQLAAWHAKAGNRHDQQASAYNLPANIDMNPV